MKYDFDRMFGHREMNSLKWDFNELKFGDRDVLSMWVADMDFAGPKEVTEALLRRAAYGVYGYSQGMDSYYQAIIDWMQKRHAWKIERDWITFSPGIVPALIWAIKAFAQPGDKVLLQSPVYHPFFTAIENNGCELVNNQLRFENGQYVMDFQDLEEKLAGGVKLFLLCSPHNPVGRVWTRVELERVAQLCLKYQVLVIADEIHFDLVYRGYEHTVFSTLSEELAQNSIVCTAPSKTFNMAGLQMSNLIIPNPKLRRSFVQVMEKNGINSPNAFGIVALEAAYRYGEEWLDQVIEYLEGNLSFLEEFLNTRIPEIKLVRPQGTYLVWLDFRELGLEPIALRELLHKQAKVALNEGQFFGPGGEDFQRLNIACPRTVLAEGLQRIEQALHNR